MCMPALQAKVSGAMNVQAYERLALVVLGKRVCFMESMMAPFCHHLKLDSRYIKQPSKHNMSEGSWIDSHIHRGGHEMDLERRQI